MKHILQQSQCQYKKRLLALTRPRNPRTAPLHPRYRYIGRMARGVSKSEIQVCHGPVHLNRFEWRGRKEWLHTYHQGRGRYPIWWGRWSWWLWWNCCEEIQNSVRAWYQDDYSSHEREDKFGFSVSTYTKGLDLSFNSVLRLLTGPQQIDYDYDYHAYRDPNRGVHSLVPEAN